MAVRQVGRVVGLWRYPVKSMAAEPLDAAELSWYGLAGDRRWAFVRDAERGSGFPWLTLRERNDMARFRPYLVDPDRPDRSAVRVVAPDGRDHALTDAALAAELAPGLSLLKQDRGTFDSMPVSLLTTASLAGLGAALGAEPDPLRFRPNLLVAPTDGDETGWIGARLSIGGAVVRVDRRDRRCVVVNVDPASGRRDPAVLRALARDHDLCFGVYGSTVTPGRIALGDPVLAAD